MRTKRYAAKLLFQFRVTTAGRNSRRRTCEERFIMFQATSAKKALAHAKQKGRDAQYSSDLGAGRRMRFEFVGVMELLHLGVECEGDEVWYEIKTMVTPQERKTELIPPQSVLQAFRMEAERKGSRK